MVSGKKKKFSCNKIQRDASFLYFILIKNCTCVRTDLLFIIGCFSTVFAAIGICHASYVAICEQGQDGTNSILTLLADSKITSMTNTYCCKHSTETPDDGQ